MFLQHSPRSKFVKVQKRARARLTLTAPAKMNRSKRRHLAHPSPTIRCSRPRRRRRAPKSPLSSTTSSRFTSAASKIQKVSRNVHYLGPTSTQAIKRLEPPSRNSDLGRSLIKLNQEPCNYIKDFTSKVPKLQFSGRNPADMHLCRLAKATFSRNYKN